MGMNRFNELKRLLDKIITNEIFREKIEYSYPLLNNGQIKKNIKIGNPRYTKLIFHS